MHMRYVMFYYQNLIEICPGSMSSNIISNNVKTLQMIINISE